MINKQLIRRSDFLLLAQGMMVDTAVRSCFGVDGCCWLFRPSSSMLAITSDGIMKT